MPAIPTSKASLPLVTLLTDFGLSDPFAGIMRGVIKTICPNADIVDLTHGIAPQDIPQGAIAWRTAWKFFPPGSVHVGVVDPGVGTSRRAIAVEIGDSLFICPDNGLLTYVAEDELPGRIVSVENPAYRLDATSRTFHGRDIFAPAAAHVASGVDIDQLGPRVDDFVRLPVSQPTIVNDSLVAHVIYFDIFGNACTDLTEAAFAVWSPPRVAIAVNGKSVTGPVESYASVDVGKALAMFASHGNLEIAVRNGDARRDLGLQIGDVIRIDRTDVNL